MSVVNECQIQKYSKALETALNDSEAHARRITLQVLLYEDGFKKAAFNASSVKAGHTLTLHEWWIFFLKLAQ